MIEQLDLWIEEFWSGERKPNFINQEEEIEFFKK